MFRPTMENAASGLTIDDWAEVTKHLEQGDSLPRLEYLLCEAKALSAIGLPREALTVAVSAMEDFCRQSSKQQRRESLADFAGRIACDMGLSTDTVQLIKEMIQARNDFIHNEVTELNSVDVRTFISTTLHLVRLRA